MANNENGRFIYFLNEVLRDEERIFKLKEAILSEDTLTIQLLYSAENAKILTDTLKEKVLNYAKNTVPSVFFVKIEYIRTFSDESSIKTSLMGFLYNEAVLIYPKLKNTEPKIEIEPSLIKITLSVPDYAYTYCETSGLKEKIEAHISKNFMEDGEVLFLPYKEEIVAVSRGKIARRSESIKTVEISFNLDMVHWGMMTRDPRYIKDICKNESPSQTICGTISNFRAIVTKDQTRTFYTFRLNDTTGTMEMKAFPRIKDAAAHANFSKLKDGDMISAEGEIKDDSYSKCKAMFVKSFTVCTINFDSIDKKLEYLPLPDKYATVFPSICKEEEFESFNIFQMKNEVPEALKDKTYVVFDFETTGLSTGSDAPIEIGAVKIVNGTITESFCTMIAPIFPEGQTELSDKIVEITGITDEMLVGAPKQSEICGDIYKFFYGATLVAHNADFDIAFLRRMGDENGYLFDNSYLDTIRLAQERMKCGKTNLDFLCEKFEIMRTQSHRGLADAMATAKLFKKLVAMPLRRK